MLMFSLGLVFEEYGPLSSWLRAGSSLNAPPGYASQRSHSGKFPMQELGGFACRVEDTMATAWSLSPLSLGFDAEEPAIGFIYTQP
jgi:hypothetical protein